MGARVVLVSPDYCFLDQAAASLSQKGHVVFRFSNPLDALNMIEANNLIDLLITRADLGPDVLCGISLAVLARAHEPKIKVLLTATPAYAEAARSVGDTVERPLCVHDLVVAAENILLRASGHPPFG
jgi:two-component SAPR family response regulator